MCVSKQKVVSMETREWAFPILQYHFSCYAPILSLA